MDAQPAYRYIVEAQEAAAAVARLKHEPIVGLDTETYWDRGANRNQVSLVQLAPRVGETLVIDVQATGVEVVRPLVEDADVQMVAHNARFDELVLLGATLQPAALVDTLRLARAALDLPSYSLAAVCAHLFGLALDKSLQSSNWRRRPLTRAQLQYAATDAFITLRVFDELQQRLTPAERWATLVRAATLTRAPASNKPRRKVKPKTPPPVLTEEERRAVAQLKRWRLARANVQHVPAYMICSDRTLAELAHARPQTLDALKTIYGLGESKIALLGQELLAAVNEAFSKTH